MARGADQYMHRPRSAQGNPMSLGEYQLSFKFFQNGGGSSFSGGAALVGAVEAASAISRLRRRSAAMRWARFWARVVGVAASSRRDRRPSGRVQMTVPSRLVKGYDTPQAEWRYQAAM